MVAVGRGGHFPVWCKEQFKGGLGWFYRRVERKKMGRWRVRKTAKPRNTREIESAIR